METKLEVSFSIDGTLIFTEELKVSNGNCHVIAAGLKSAMALMYVECQQKIDESVC